MVKNIEDFPNLTLEDANRFWDDFTERHPDIAAQLPNRSFINGSIVTFQPAKIDSISYTIYERYLKMWLFKNGFWVKPVDEIYVLLNDGDNNGVRAVLTETIISIKPVNENLSAIEIKEDNMEIAVVIYVKENVDFLKRVVYIF
jgi:hypothetical protein